MKKALEFISGFLKKLGEDDSIAYAYQLTYGLLLSIFPFLIFLMTLIAYLGLDASYILNLISRTLPEDISEILRGPVVDLVLVQRGTLLYVSVLVAIYTASGGFRAFMKGMNKTMGFEDHRSFLYKYLISILWVIMLAGTILLALLGIVFGRQILNLIIVYFPHFPAEGLLEVLRLLIPIVLIFGILSMAYMFISAKNIRFRYAFPGALFSTLAWITVTFTFQFYVNNYANYSRFYGTLGAVIGLLLWLSLTSIIMILGSSLNAYLIIIHGVEHPYFRKRWKDKGKVRTREIIREPEKVQTLPERKYEILKRRFKDTLEKEETTDTNP